MRKLRRFVVTAMFAAAMTSLIGSPAIPATFDVYRIPDQRATMGILVRGDIGGGDAAAFMATLNVVAHSWRGAHVAVIDLDTPGGQVDSALAIATIVGLNGYDTMIYPGSTCASACSLIFFAGVRKIIGAGARIGVHRASIGPSQHENQATYSATLRMTGWLRRLGIPKTITDKMLATPPSRISWLTARDLTGVRGILFGPPPPGMESLDYAAGWRLGRRFGSVTVCPTDLSQFGDGCRAGAAVAASSAAPKH